MAIKKTKRMAFNFLRSYFDVLTQLENDKDKLDFLTAIINKQFLDEDPKDLGFISNLCYESQRHAIEKSVNGWKTAKNTDLKGAPTLPLGGDPTPPLAPPPKEEQEKEKEQEKGKSILCREQEFKNSLKTFLDDFGKDTLNDFYSYWTEKKPKGRKMRFEMEKTFDLKRRLERWRKNNFNNKNNLKSENNEQLKIITTGIRHENPDL